MKSGKAVFCLFFIALNLCLFNCRNNKQETQESLASIDLLRGEVTLCGNGQLGEVNFGLVCDDKARETFNVAMSLLHSFEYEEAEKAFVKVIEIDPQCAMAYWGIAMSNFHSLWLQTGTDYLEKGAKILAAASALPKSEREQDYFDAISVFYNDWETINHLDRVLLFEKKMEAVYTKNKNDHEAAIFYSLALTAAADPSDKTYTNQRKSGKILESLYADQPNHPGIAHYTIHNYDYPELAELALPTARRYAQIAPASAHAQHMPSHIFTRLGLWEESIQSNINSTASAVCYAKSINPDGHWDEELHGMDYLVYAYLQIGENEKANEQYEYLKTFKQVFPVNFKIAYTAAAIPARMALENKDWLKASKLQLPPLGISWEKFPWQKAILHYARGLGHARLGDVKASNHELDSLKFLKQVLVELKDDYKVNQVEIQINTVQAWIYFVQGKKEDALSLMKQAATMEYNTAKHPVTPGEVLPAGELLGDLLLSMNKPTQALEAYEFDLTQHPNRFNGLYGAAVAAKMSGDKIKAKKYFQLLIDQTKNASSSRKEIQVAKTSIGDAQPGF